MNEGRKLGLEDRIDELEKLVGNLQIAVNLSQALLKKVSPAQIRLDKDVSNIMGVINDLQYRTLAMVQSGVFVREELNSIADSLKLKDFNDASDKEDADSGFTTGHITNPDSIVIITSTSMGDNNDSGIFRSKLAIKDAVLPELKEKLVGLVVGDHIVAKINGVDHDIELLGIRERPIKNSALLATPTE
jgi:hypothetical protein